MHPDCVAFTIGNSDSEGRLVRLAGWTRDLGVDHEVIELTPGEIPPARYPGGYPDALNSLSTAMSSTAVISRLLFRPCAAAAVSR